MSSVVDRQLANRVGLRPVSYSNSAFDSQKATFCHFAQETRKLHA